MIYLKRNPHMYGKTIVDPFIGKYSLYRGCFRCYKSDDTLLNVSKEEEARLNKLYVLEGSKPCRCSRNSCR